MAKNSGQDLAVIFFAGHGTTLGDRFYLLPYGVDARTQDNLRGSAISASDFRDWIADLAKAGRVLLLLDACHSGAATGDGASLISNGDMLKAALAASNVTALTSSSANEESQEDEKWHHGAFTKVLLDSLSQEADENHDGLISMSEMARYIATHLPGLAAGQHPGIEQRFESGIFIAGQ